MTCSPGSAGGKTRSLPGPERSTAKAIDHAAVIQKKIEDAQEQDTALVGNSECEIHNLKRWHRVQRLVGAVCILQLRIRALRLAGLSACGARRSLFRPIQAYPFPISPMFTARPRRRASAFGR